MKLAGAHVNDDTYESLVALAMKNNCTLAGQLRHLINEAIKPELPFTAECFSRYKHSRGDFERCPGGDKKFSTERLAQDWINQSRPNPNSDTDYRYTLVFPKP